MDPSLGPLETSPISKSKGVGHVRFSSGKILVVSVQRHLSTVVIPPSVMSGGQGVILVLPVAHVYMPENISTGFVLSLGAGPVVLQLLHLQTLSCAYRLYP